MSEIKLLDHGYVRLIESWGSDSRIIEAARMSTDKGFQGWGPKTCPGCKDSPVAGTIFVKRFIDDGMGSEVECESCKGTGEVLGDEKLLKFLWAHKHLTPFEMAGAIFEVQAPIFVFREWHRHRTQSYNELSARYTPLPDLNYVPTKERALLKGGNNKQAQGERELSENAVDWWLDSIVRLYERAEEVYRYGLQIGIPKELARLVVPVGRYSRMRASANLRNWLAFLTLRMDQSAQFEIRQYANAVHDLLKPLFPRTLELFDND
jgi:thymidylate synthase (FAD)